jgi:hypothetical protein
MLATASRTSIEPDQKRPAPIRPGVWVLLALLAGILIVAHGCHGDEDTELFLRGWWTWF